MNHIKPLIQSCFLSPNCIHLINLTELPVPTIRLLGLGLKLYPSNMVTGHFDTKSFRYKLFETS